MDSLHVFGLNRLRWGLGVALAASTAAPLAANDSLAIDFAFIRPDFVNWHIDRRDAGGGCAVLGALAPPSQWGLPQDLFFLAGEPLASQTNGRDEQIIVRQSYVDPNQLRWWVKHNDQANGGFSGWWSEGDFGLVGDTAFIWRRAGTPDRAAVKQGPFLIADSNRNLKYDPGTDLVMLWDVPIGPNDRIFGAPIHWGASTIVVYRATTSTWELYGDAGFAIGTTPYATFTWGVPGMIPALADADGDGTPDLILFNPSTKQVWINYWENATTWGGFGIGTDCVLNYAPKLNAIQSGPWFQFVAMNLGGYDDWDGDGVPNNLDGCPWDPHKIAPGVCGCGTPDTDSDGDGVPDCIDLCPWDPLKIEPGICDCGTPDTDSDGDGVPDCIDLCPWDPLKIEPGICGCGTPDTDSDGDGVPDCIDGCPQDPDKVDPGICDCGTPDTDSDGDGVPDCIDGCPHDPSKVSPGLCGCGVPDLLGDLDCDGVIGALDLGMLLNLWGPCPLTCIADLNGDGVVDAIDLGILLAHWSQ